MRVFVVVVCLLVGWLVVVVVVVLLLLLLLFCCCFVFCIRWGRGCTCRRVYIGVDAMKVCVVAKYVIRRRVYVLRYI